MKIAKQIIDYHKTAFDNTFDTFSVVQEQMEKMVNNFLQQASLIPEETKEAIINWVNFYKNGQVEFKKTADKNYEKVTQYFNKQEIETISNKKAKKAK